MGKHLTHSDILFWNARGIKTKKLELVNHLEANNIPVALIAETHLQPSITFKCANYFTYRSDRTTQRSGGTAILARRDINHIEFPLPQLQRIEATAIQLTLNKEPVILVSVYSPPGKIFERDLDLLIGLGHKVILAGDFNAKHSMWGSRLNNTAGQTLLSHYYKNNYIISAPAQSTFFPDRLTSRSDILDIAILSNVLTKHSIRTLGNLSNSDHRPVLMSFNSHFEPTELKTIFNYSAANWNLFQTGILNRLNMQCLHGICSINEIDVAATRLTDIIPKAARQAIPLKTISYSSLQISSSTRALIEIRNRLRNQWQRTHDIAYHNLT
jgi:endonuclease/exonuclease/phosphatase family metal-dependent hydrolase